jgi:hypothetical protein
MGGVSSLRFMKYGPEMGDSMRAQPAGLFVILSLLLGACGGCKHAQAPPPLDKDLLIGKWETDDPEQFVQTCEFAADHSMKMTIKKLPEAVPGKYTWSGDKTLSVEYQPSEEMQKQGKVLLAEIKKERKELGEKTGGPTGAGILSSANLYPDELPAKEDFQVGLSPVNGPVLLLTTEKGLKFHFKKKAAG